MSTIKIAVSGPNASGKTTLADALARKLGVPLIDENVKPLYEAQGRFIKLTRDGAPLEERREAKKQWAASFMNWIESRGAQYAGQPSFVADRWEADILDLWLVFFAKERNVDALTSKIMAAVHQRASQFDVAVLTPFGKPFTEENNNADLKRQTSYTNRLLNSMLTSGIILTTPRLKVVRIPGNITALEERVELVEKALRRIAGASGAAA